MSRQDNMLGKLTDNFGTIHPPEPWEIAAAQRYVTARAFVDDDQQMILSMLGLEAA